MRVREEVAIAAPPSAVWPGLADIASHVDWMADAESIAFTSEQRDGVGTTFECVTKIGPLKTVDKMRVVEWVDGTAIGVVHHGLFVGTGVFELAPGPNGSSNLTWTEDLRFPVYLGGVVGAAVARPILRRVWRGNLRRFAAIIEGRYRNN